MATYTDIDPTFSENPLTHDVALVTDSQAIINACKNLILTPFYTRPFQSTIASGIENELFENASPIIADNIKTKIESVIKTYEPRVESVFASVKLNAAQDAYICVVVILPKNSLQKISFNVFLNRVI